MRRLWPLGVLLCLLLSACSGDSPRTSIRFWHFWSEPAQRRVLDSLVAAFEAQHPDIDVECTELSWADGKAKLQLAFNAGTQPDVVHLGADWFAEFDEGGVFAPLPDSIPADGRAARWLVNVRAYVTRPVKLILRVGIATSDPHNVIKRCLPFLHRDSTVRFLTRLPVAPDMDSALVHAIDHLRMMVEVRQAVMDRSRQLDDALLRGDIDGVLTGPWIIDMARSRGVPLMVQPMASILNGDVLAISAASNQKVAAAKLIGYLSSYANARAFCMAISDAGFPADLHRAETDTAFTNDALTRGFLLTAQMSRPLPHSSRMLAIEPVLERMLDRCFRAKDKRVVEQIVSEARREVEVLESR